MVERKYFTDSKELRKPLTGLVSEEIPSGVRHAIANLVSPVDKSMTARMWHWVVAELDWSPSLLTEHKYSGSERANQRELLDAIFKREYSDWLDLASAIYYYCSNLGQYSPRPFGAEEFRSVLNHRLTRHYSAYFMAEDGTMQEPGSSVAETAIAEARAILSDPRMTGPDRQFQDAVLDFHRRPSPNFEGAVTNALNALEGVVRIALGDATVRLGPGIKRVAEDRGLHGALASSVSSLYGYASQDGGRHGLVGDPKVDSSIAEYCLHQSAATVVFIARLYEFAVAKGVVAA